jgi:hypothetical protein
MPFARAHATSRRAAGVHVGATAKGGHACRGAFCLLEARCHGAAAARPSRTPVFDLAWRLLLNLAMRGEPLKVTVLGVVGVVAVVAVMACHADGAATGGHGGTASGGETATGGQEPIGGGSATGGGAGFGNGGIAATGGSSSGGTAIGGHLATGGNASGGVSGTGGSPFSACALAQGTCLTSCTQGCESGATFLPAPNGCPVTESNAVCGARCCVPSGHGGQGGRGGAGGGGGQGAGGSGTGGLCGNRACGSDEFCCGPPACGHCAKVLTGPNCPATCP